VQKRGGSGIKTLKVTPKTGKIVSMYILNNSEEHDLVIISKSGQTIRTPLNKVSTLGRATQGVRVMRLDEGDKVASATIISQYVSITCNFCWAYWRPNLGKTGHNAL
jgi:DNA gyrase subunit A